MGGFGGRTYASRDKCVHVEPATREHDGGLLISMGYPLFEMTDYLPDCAKDLAEYLSCPKRAAAPELYEALDYLMSAHGEQLTDAFERAQAALAKARGEQA